MADAPGGVEIEGCLVLPGVPYRQGVEEAMRLLAGRWVAAVLAALAEGPLHYTDLLTAINDNLRRAGTTGQRPLTEKVLTDTLRRMERDGLLLRHREPTPLPSVWYELTPMARSLLRSLRPLAEWAQLHHKELAAAHKRRNEAPG
jgi:DNA-binding HxlR family transcriptional regulator